MRKMILSLFLVFNLFSVEKSYSYGAVGDFSCGDFLANVENEYLKMFTVNWALGYMTGRNYSENKRKGKDMGSLESTKNSLFFTMKKYCRENPLKYTADAMEHIYNNELD